jgi:hypothetical protein
LRRYHLLSFESKCAALEFYQSLARETDNLHYKKDKVCSGTFSLATVANKLSGSVSRIFANDKTMA